VSLPVLMQPRAAFTMHPTQPAAGEWTESALLDALRRRGPGLVHQRSCPQRAALWSYDGPSQTWLSAPGAGSGVIVFDVVVMAAAGGMPLLELSNLALPIASVSPALQTT
jgi:hypothetical protein